MKKIYGLIIPLVALTLVGCSGAFWGGTGTGALGAGAGYEINAEAQMRQVQKDYDSGKITKEEYDIRKDQIKRDSLLK
ncbi:MAG: hypothetical protein KBD53_03775 [Candidatus Omnitrophica bacterium]|nr:hypothetical protein [Candidatus Omnitrophota bacterium]